MTNAWDAAKEASDNIQTGSYVSLKNDKDKVVGIFLGDPAVVNTYYNEDTKQSEPYTDQHRKDGKKVNTKFKFNFLVVDPRLGDEAVQKGELKTYEATNATFKSILKNRDKYTLSYLYEIQRQGAAGNTKTVYSVLPERGMKEHEIAFVSKLKIKTTEELLAGKEATNDDDSDANSYAKSKADRGPISGDDAATFMTRLKILPRDKLDAFLKRFGVAKVKELMHKDLQDAKMFLASLEGPPPNEPPKGAGEVDPFGD